MEILGIVALVLVAVVFIGDAVVAHGRQRDLERIRRRQMNEPNNEDPS